MTATERIKHNKLHKLSKTERKEFLKDLDEEIDQIHKLRYMPGMKKNGKLTV